MNVSFYSCLCTIVNMGNLSQSCYYVFLFLWINFSFLSNYLLWNLSYETNLLNGNVLWTISTYHYSIIGFIDLAINIIFVNYFLECCWFIISVKVSIECVLVTIISVKWTNSLNLIFIINKIYLNPNILNILLLVGLDIYLPN